MLSATNPCSIGRENLLDLKVKLVDGKFFLLCEFCWDSWLKTCRNVFCPQSKHFWVGQRELHYSPFIPSVMIYHCLSLWTQWYSFTSPFNLFYADFLMIFIWKLWIYKTHQNIVYWGSKPSKYYGNKNMENIISWQN